MRLPPEASHAEPQFPPTPRFDAAIGTLWHRKFIVGGDLFVGWAAAHYNALDTHTLVNFATAAVIVEFARAGVVKNTFNEILHERLDNKQILKRPFFDERTIFQMVRDAWHEKTIQYSPMQMRKRKARG